MQKRIRYIGRPSGSNVFFSMDGKKSESSWPYKSSFSRVSMSVGGGACLALEIAWFLKEAVGWIEVGRWCRKKDCQTCVKRAHKNGESNFRKKDNQGPQKAKPTTSYATQNPDQLTCCDLLVGSSGGGFRGGSRRKFLREVPREVLEEVLEEVLKEVPKGGSEGVKVDYDVRKAF
ncbi:hypothetical protein B0T21DRAFT_349352 [Apiosordaria backusii]|uniref:Uncharacterized protein n=1 Tax=Apiosordaria backusii TaxID=314023 RepID=A0AA40EFU8_9PEZI|nr:hypothetical protein B0T21DRAFT_349352 [Apiosordaria backusii]